MSTRCNVILCDENGNEKANLYHHWDGDPENMVPKLQRMIPWAVDTLHGRTDDIERIAAILIAMSADEKGIPAFEPCLKRHEDIEYLYRVEGDLARPEIDVIDMDE